METFETSVTALINAIFELSTTTSNNTDALTNLTSAILQQSPEV